MGPEAADLAYLADMLDAARSIRRFTEGIGYGAFAADEMRFSAVERQFEILGEAARLLTEAFRDVHPELPTRKMIGLRNVIAHGYAEVDHRVLHHLAKVEIPQLIGTLEKLLAGPPGG
jgi:uncharacterized protein with HEPN domain